MLKNLQLKNFKSLRHFNINFKPLTILLGKNSSGKSSFLQSLLLIKQTVESRDQWTPLVPRGDYVDLGSYRDFVYGHELTNNITIDLTFMQSDEIREVRRIRESPYRLFGGLYLMRPEYFWDKRSPAPFTRNPVSISVTYSYSKEKDKIILKELQYKVGKDLSHFIVNRKKTYFDKYAISYFSTSGSRKIEVDFEDVSVQKFFLPQFKKMDAKLRVLEGQQYKKDTESRKREAFYDMNEILFYVDSEIREFTKNLIHIEPVREKPKRTYIPAGEIKQDVGLRGETAVDMLYANRALSKKVITVSTYEELSRSMQNIKHWLKRLNIASALNFPRLKQYAYLFELRHPSLRINSNIVDHGFGLSQVLPVIVQGFFAAPGSVLLLEQPEIHLHPKAQADLAELLIDFTKRDITVIAETHSEHIIERLQLLVAKEPMLRDRIAILLFQIGKRGTEVTKLELSDKGKRVNWPKDFIDDFLNGGLYDALELETINIKKQTKSFSKIGEKK